MSKKEREHTEPTPATPITVGDAVRWNENPRWRYRVLEVRGDQLLLRHIRIDGGPYKAEGAYWSARSSHTKE